jgi:hypothetical protein
MIMLRATPFPAVAAGVTLVGGIALAFAVDGEGASNPISLVVLPGLVVTLFVLPLRSAARPDVLRRIGGWAAAVLGGGLLLLAVAAPKFALLLALLAALYLVIGWPLAPEWLDFRRDARSVSV